MPMPRQQPHRSKQDYRTPTVFLDAVRDLLGIKSFDFDFAADAKNTVVPHRYWAAQDNSLSIHPRNWALQTRKDGWGWCNPPYTSIEPWVSHCRIMAELSGRVVLLVPASVGSNWYRDHVHKRCQVLFLNGRIPFMPDKPTWLYPKDCMLCLYGPNQPKECEVWSWR